MFEIPAQAGGSDKNSSPGYPMVLCLLSTEKSHWEAAVSKWEGSGAAWWLAVRSLEIQRDSVTGQTGDLDSETPKENWFLEFEKSGNNS